MVAASLLNYNIYRGSSSGNESWYTQVGDVNFFTDTGATNGQYYFYIISAVNAYGNSSLSNEANAYPTTPLLILVTTLSTGANLTWSPLPYIVNYSIY